MDSWKFENSSKALSTDVSGDIDGRDEGPGSVDSADGSLTSVLIPMVVAEGDCDGAVGFISDSANTEDTMFDDTSVTILLLVVGVDEMSKLLDNEAGSCELSEITGPVVATDMDVPISAVDIAVSSDCISDSVTADLVKSTELDGLDQGTGVESTLSDEVESGTFNNDVIGDSGSMVALQ